MLSTRHIIFGLLLLNLAMSSCSTHKEMLYFREEAAARQADSSILSVNNFSPLEIQNHDVLYINIRSFDQTLAAPFNLSGDRSGVSLNTSPTNNYQVDEAGFVDLPVLGKIPLAGKTINQAKDTLLSILGDYLEQASINMRLLNFRVSILGEVNSPGTFEVTTDRITVLEALALAKDLTPYANARNILVIREQNGQRILGEINLQTTTFINSDFYYLKQGDVVYVEPRKDKQAVVRDGATELLTIIASGVQILLGVATIIIITNQ